jgi:hypothetical protein
MQRPLQRTKFSATPSMDFRSKIRDIVEQIKCKRHGKDVGEPCWWIPSGTRGLYAAICQHRIRQVYNGKIDPKSVSNRRPSKEPAR